MTDILYNHALNKNVVPFAMDLWSGVSSGTVTPEDLLFLIEMLGQAEIRYSNDDESDEWCYISHDIIFNYCSGFAFSVLKKKLLDGSWTLTDGILSDGKNSASISSIRSSLQPDSTSPYDPAVWYQGQIDKVENLDREKETFVLALLDHITEENALVIFYLTDTLSEYGLYSPEALKEYQHIWPEQLTRDKFTEALSAANHEQYLYFFMESANEYETQMENDAGNRAEKAETVAPAVLAATEEDYWLSQRATFPYTAYMLLTKQMSDMDFKVKEEIEDLNKDERLSQEEQQILAAAADGIAQAQNAIAELYLTRKSLDEDGIRAAHWLRLAAQQGIASAQSNYGVALQNGLGGIQPDNAEAIEWFMKAAEQGLPEAQLNLGLAYSAGRGIERDLQTGMEWIRKAAENGNEVAKLILDTGLIING